VSASAFLSPELKAEQADEARNRGMLWVEQGQALWQTPPAAGAPACTACHGEVQASMTGTATRYPKVMGGRVVNLEGAINACRTARQNAPALGYDSQDLLALTALVAHQSRGLPMAVVSNGPAADKIAVGRDFYETRQGQLNLACSQCHDDHVGRKLRGDTISGGVGTGYPAYRLEWQGVGSLYRRLRACQIGVRAEPFAAGSDEHLALELYLAVRANGLPIETPALRR
jgi:sulfur-oxidizing protein SoxA